MHVRAYVRSDRQHDGPSAQNFSISPKKPIAKNVALPATSFTLDNGVYRT